MLWSQLFIVVTRSPWPQRSLVWVSTLFGTFQWQSLDPWFTGLDDTFIWDNLRCILIYSQAVDPRSVSQALPIQRQLEVHGAEWMIKTAFPSGISCGLKTLYGLPGGNDFRMGIKRKFFHSRPQMCSVFSIHRLAFKSTVLLGIAWRRCNWAQKKIPTACDNFRSLSTLAMDEGQWYNKVWRFL